MVRSAEWPRQIHVALACKGCEDMKATEIQSQRRGRHEPYPIITFEIDIENDNSENNIVIINISSTVRTASPMSRLFLGRLIPCEAFMSIDAGKSRSFRFDLDLGWKGLSDIERARKVTDDVLLDIQTNTVYMEVKDFTPIKFRWEGFHVGDKGGNNWIRIPQSDWSKLKTDLGYGEMRIIEVTEETYKLVEEYMKKTKTIEIDDAINNAMLELLRPKGER